MRQTEDGQVRLEDRNSTELLQLYLNPSLREVEDKEAINAAKLIHWSIHDPEHRKVQVETAMTKAKNCMPIYDRKYDLHGLTDKTCAVVADIRHQGRARSLEIIDAINTRGTEDNVYQRLLKLGVHAYKNRIHNLENFINKLEAEGIFGTKRYNRTVNNFV